MFILYSIPGAGLWTLAFGLALHRPWMVATGSAVVATSVALFIWAEVRAAIRRTKPMNKEDLPIFEVRPHGGEPFKIWADGRVEGFPEGHAIINRIPHTIRAAIMQESKRA